MALDLVVPKYLHRQPPKKKPAPAKRDPNQNPTAYTKWAQTLFNKHGAELKVTGVNDPATKAIIEGFQEATGLPITGTMTPETEAKLRQIDKSATGFLPKDGYLGSPNQRVMPKPLKLQGTASAGAGSTLDFTPGQDMRMMTGPGGSPAPRFREPPMPTPEEVEKYWAGDISKPPPWSGGPVELPELTTGNSPLALGADSYAPPPDPSLPPTATIPNQWPPPPAPMPKAPQQAAVSTNPMRFVDELRGVMGMPTDQEFPDPRGLMSKLLGGQSEAATPPSIEQREGALDPAAAKRALMQKMIEGGFGGQTAPPPVAQNVPPPVPPTAPVGAISDVGSEADLPRLQQQLDALQKQMELIQQNLVRQATPGSP